MDRNSYNAIIFYQISRLKYVYYEDSNVKIVKDGVGWNLAGLLMMLYS